ncbi:MATE family efflux transporter [uncultured Senegalimassilia sp.]|uniref:MATE family efflux transporter n=1 Tax=uncultured Senegalimassilia sp. TaxID=1714350 RepID=UPI0027DBBA63|nr:MATE family efflux transporter [uncultured Senegalimassilia sp.]
MGAQTENSELIKRTFGKYLAMSILITLSATLGMMIDNVIAGNLLGSGAVAAIGMSLSVFMLFSGCAGILETGAVALCARALGNRDADRVNVLFSVSLAAALAVGAALSAGGVAGADALATMLGAASGELHADTASYLSGICSGAFAIVLLQLLMGFTRLDNAPQLGIVAIVGMSVCDVIFNLVAVCVLDLGLRGMGLATALAYCVAVGICCTHFLGKGNTLHLVNPVPHAGQLAGVLKTGLPDSLTRATVVVRTFTFNWLLLTVASAGAVAALSMLSSVNSFASSVTIGVGQTATLLCGIFFGEEDRGALKATLRTGMRMGLALSCALCAAVFAFAPQVVGLFGLEGDAEAFGVVAVRAFILCVPIDLINQLFVNYYQGTGNVRAASAIAVGQSGLFAVLFALGTVWFWGATAVWMSFLVGEAVTLALQLVVASVLWKRRAAKGAAPAIAGDRDGIAAGGAVVDKATLLDKMMYLPETFQADWRASASFACAPTSEAVVACSQQVAAWCESHGVDGRRSYLVPLAVEEMAANAVEHGFTNTKHPAIDVKLILKRDGTLVLRVRDNGAAFNPMDLDLSAADPCSAVGIRMLRQGVREVEYQNTVGLNNVVVTLPAPSGA